MKTLRLSCHCGRVRIETGKRPDFVHSCNCTLCSKSGAHWGYFHPSEVRIAGETRAYRREDKASPAALMQFCGTCSSTTHFVLTDEAVAKVGNTLIGVNMRLADETDLAGVELRFPDGRAWSGEGAFGYVREPDIMGRERSSG